jgi:predicted DNA-binding antitoxin AbrB/MazE fold protein
MGKPEGDNNLGGERPAKKLPAVVEKIVKPVSPAEPEKVQIAVHGADELYREIRVENTLEDATGEKVRLKQGAEVDVIIEAPPDAVETKPT